MEQTILEIPSEVFLIPVGREEISSLPLLASHRGTPPDLVLRWNSMTSGSSTIDVVVHLHGYSERREHMSLPRDKEPHSGLDFANPEAPNGQNDPRRTRPTLGILPRGNYFGGRSGSGYNFPALITRDGMRDLIDFSLRYFANKFSLPGLSMDRLILTAHSGGGAPLMRILQFADPHEIHVFDALYQDASSLIAWARSRIQRDAAALEDGSGRDPGQYMPAGGGALRVLYRPGTGTEANSQAVHRALCAALPPIPRLGAVLAGWYRVEHTAVEHGRIPRRFGWRLLADAGATLPDSTQSSCQSQPTPERSSKPAGPSTPAESLPGFTAAEEKALRITSTFETGRPLSFSGLTGNFDGQGISFGLLQWNIGTGSLQPLLREFERRQSQRFEAIFGPDAARFRQVLSQDQAAQMDFARSMNDARNHIQEPWAGYFHQLSEDPAFQQIELAAVRNRMDAAARQARQLGLQSERGLALIFDIVTQHGRGWQETTRCHTCSAQTRRARIEAARAALQQQAGRSLTELDVLNIIGNVTADTSLPRWQADVRARRMVIVNGRGRVHGHDFDLAREYGLGDAPWEPTPVSPPPTPPNPPSPAPPAPAGGLEYLPAGGRRYAPAMGTFRCAPDPATVTPASQLPAPTTDPDSALRGALRGLSLSEPQVSDFEGQGGLRPLRPVAALFGQAALQELLRRLRYGPGQILNPPKTDDMDRSAARRLGVSSPALLLAPRLLLAVPGHFRELARRAPTPAEAHALENLGWLLMRTLRQEVLRETGRNWWLPAAPPFVIPFANPLPPLSPEFQRVVLQTNLIDATLSLDAYTARFHRWDAGLPGRLWRLETGLETSTQGPGRPFYEQLLSLPTNVDISAQRLQIDAIWQRRIAETEQRFPQDQEAQTRALTRCEDHYLDGQNLLQRASLQGLQMVYDYPALDGGRLITSLNVLGAIQPGVEQLFRSIYELGWNDLLFQTAGAGCFRGVKLPRDPARPQRHHQAARRMSNHSLGIAMDFNHFENGQNVPGSMDPRIAAIFEAFHFRWGRCFPVPDPMHFEYCGGGC